MRPRDYNFAAKRQLAAAAISGARRMLDELDPSHCDFDELAALDSLREWIGTIRGQVATILEHEEVEAIMQGHGLKCVDCHG